MSILSCIKHYEKIYNDINLLIITPEEMPSDFDKSYFTSCHVIKLNRKSYIRRFLGSLIAQIPGFCYQYWRHRKDVIPNVKEDSDIHLHGVSLWFIRDYFKTNKRIWLHSHDVMADAFNNIASGKSMYNLVWNFELSRIRNFERSHLANNAYNTCITDFDKQRYFDLYKLENIDVFYRTVSFPRVKNVYSGHFRFISIGSLDLRKSVGMSGFIANQWPKIMELYTNAEFHLYGRGSELFHDPESRIFGWGYLDEINTDLSDFDFFVNPQTAGSGLQFKSLYAILSGFILISTDLGLQGISRVPGCVYDLDEFLYHIGSSNMGDRYKASVTATEDYREELLLENVINKNKFLTR
jgi:hypothetical protein